MRFTVKTSIKLATTTLFILNAYNRPVYALPETPSTNNNDKNKNDAPQIDIKSFINNIASKGKQAFDSVDPDFAAKFGFSNDNIEEISKQAHNLVGSAAIPKISYGFVMGYSSGYCLKKTSKFFAFILGGMFITIQTLSYNGYLAVNYDKLKQDAEGVLDLNRDGKVDENDALYAYNKAMDVFGYHMPTGGGFAVGFAAGLRS